MHFDATKLKGPKVTYKQLRNIVVTAGTSQNLPTNIDKQNGRR
jgi:hypothetical protein